MLAQRHILLDIHTDYYSVLDGAVRGNFTCVIWWECATIKYMSEKQQKQPWQKLGEKLKNIRQKLHESVAEVSGAVEIDEQSLQRIEQGKERPSEDILMLLINHFGVQDDDAASLWQLAGYDDPSDEDHNHNHTPQDNQNRTMVMIMAVDPRVIYSDGAQVTANANGVILGFSQGVGTPGAITTAKVGM